VGVGSLLELVASACPDRVALGPSRGGVTFDELLERSRGGAAVLRETGATHVAYLGLIGPDFVTAVYASALAGLPITPLNYRLPDDQLAGLLGQLDGPVVLADPDMAARVGGSPRVILEVPDWIDRAGSVAASPGDLSPEIDDLVAVHLFTSGTTASPKAVVLRHQNLVAYILQTVDFLGADERECALVCVPPYHIAGIASVISNVYAARRVVHLPEFTPGEWLELVKREHVTQAMVVPTMLSRIVDHLGDGAADVPSLATLSYGGARTTPKVLERALAQFPGTGFVNAYGSTETSSTVTLLGAEDHRLAAASDDPTVRARLQSAGRAVPGVELQIRDAGGRPLPAGQPGDLWVRGAQVSGEYAGIGSALDDEGWYPTRDRAWLDADGYLFIEGRTDDTIIRGGENIAPAEIEDVLLQHPAVRDVAVVGLPDDEWGERITAVVVGVPGTVIRSSDLSSYARGRLRSSRTPDEFVFWPELPHNATGKLLRSEVVGRLLAETTSAAP
jgi:acyl-CoA synthetase (AMP-forming)/AMP-acid ligase II